MSDVHVVFVFFNDTATTEIYTLSLHDALPIFQLENVEVVNARAEDYIQISKRREYYDLGFCRGVSKLAVILEYMIPFLKVGAFFLPQKMVGTEEEKEAENALQALKSCIEEEYIRRLPYSEEIGRAHV